MRDDSVSPIRCRNTCRSSRTCAWAAARPRRPPARAITVEDLLLHTSGLSHRTSDLYRELQVRSRADTLQQFVTKISRAPLMEDPGTRFRYSEATTVLGRLVEVWSQQPFDRFLQERVFGPLKMTDTRFWVAAGCPVSPGDGLRPGHERLAGAGRDRSGALHRAARAHRGRSRVSCRPRQTFCDLARMLLNGGVLDGARVLRERPRRASWPTGYRPRSCRHVAARWDGGSANVSVVIGPVGCELPGTGR